MKSVIKRQIKLCSNLVVLDKKLADLPDLKKCLVPTTFLLTWYVHKFINLLLMPNIIGHS